MIKKVFFDFDGVVVDSEPIHAKTKELTLKAYGIEYPPEIFDQFKGIPENEFFIHVSEHLDPLHRPFGLLIKKRHECLAEMLPGMPFIDGVVDCIKLLKERGVMTVLVTSSKQMELDNINKYLNFMHLFDHVVPAEATAKHKPNPDPYLKALEMVHTDACDVIVIEDSPNGIISGKSAGCRVFAITTSFPEVDLVKSGADMVFDDFRSIQRVLTGSTH